MTNLLFSIITVLVTNVTESTNERYEQYPGPCPDGRIGCGVMHGWVQGPKIAEATERTLTTTYSRATNAVCADPLIPSMLLGSCELSNRVEVFERQWVPRTNWVADAKPALSGHVGASTNNGSYGIQWNSNLMFRSQSLTVTNLLHVSTNDYSNLNRDYYFPTNKLHVNHPAGGTNTSTSESCALCRELAGNRAKP